MDEYILKLIKCKASVELAFMCDKSKKSYIKMCYAGLRHEYDKLSKTDIAQEVDYTPNGVRNLLARWDELVDKGDVTTNIIADSYIKHKNGHSDEEIFGADAAKVDTDDVQSTFNKSDFSMLKKPREYKFKLFNLTLTKDEIRRERICIRESIKHMEEMCKQPSCAGIASGAMDAVCRDKGWLSQESAAMYCGCSDDALAHAANEGIVKRRIYIRNGKRNYYEYKLSSLDDLINKIGLK